MSFAVNLKTFSKYLDQPALVKKMTSATNIALPTFAVAYTVYDTIKAPKNERKKTFIKDASILSLTVASALLATRGLKIKGKKILPGLMHEDHHAHAHSIKHSHKCSCSHNHAHSNNTQHAQAHEHKHLYDKTNPNKAHYESELDEIMYTTPELKSKELLYKVKNNKILSLKEIEKLTAVMKNRGGISKIIPDSHSHSPFEELTNLSWIGLLPVLGGVSGGILGDILTKDKWKEKLPNKIKEGTYQYLNNIFLCNVGAGIAMFAMNKLNVKNKLVRLGAMLTGVIGVGLIAGSAIANFVGKNFINPIFDKSLRGEKKDFSQMIKDLNKERHPEALDLSLHIDDVASVGFMSGMKWIGPILPILYSVSGYRAGIGYRNEEETKKK